MNQWKRFAYGLIAILIFCNWIVFCSKAEAGWFIHDIDTVREYCGKSFIDHPSPIKTVHYDKVMDDLITKMNKNAQKYLAKRLQKLAELDPKSWEGYDPKGIAQMFDHMVWRDGEIIYLIEMFPLIEYDVPRLLRHGCWGEILTKLFTHVVIVNPIDDSKQYFPTKE